MQAKMYDIGTASNLSQLESLTGNRIAIGSGTVTLYTNDLNTSNIISNTLPYRCGSLILPVHNGKVAGAELTIITSDNPASAVSFLQSGGDNYLVAGQLISGYDVLTKLSAGDVVNSASFGAP